MHMQALITVSLMNCYFLLYAYKTFPVPSGNLVTPPNLEHWYLMTPHTPLKNIALHGNAELQGRIIATHAAAGVFSPSYVKSWHLTASGGVSRRLGGSSNHFVPARDVARRYSKS
jgi:hypothetical protein